MLAYIVADECSDVTKNRYQYVTVLTHQFVGDGHEGVME